ncbi:PKD domain-containing protein [Georgenia sp. MJ206]|uniref:PKD domain-containing protein n=1 Tax=Georgenia wangjunii TaxID=3117730 RepID=UPI002F262BE1
MMLFVEGPDRNWVSSCNLDEIAGTENTPWWERIEPGEPGEVEGDAPIPPGQPVIVTAQELQSLILDSGGLTVQPERPWVLVNMETIVMTGASEQMLGTVVLGVPVRVRAIPVEFTWDFGDGSAPLVGTDPGAAWPNHTVSHVYTSPGIVDVSLSTQWDGYFQPEGGTSWIPVAGRAVTTETSDPIEVVTAVPRLVTGN